MENVHIYHKPGDCVAGLITLDFGNYITPEPNPPTWTASWDITTKIAHFFLLSANSDNRIIKITYNFDQNKIPEDCADFCGSIVVTAD